MIAGSSSHGEARDLLPSTSSAAAVSPPFGGGSTYSRDGVILSPVAATEGGRSREPLTNPDRLEAQCMRLAVLYALHNAKRRHQPVAALRRRLILATAEAAR